MKKRGINSSMETDIYKIRKLSKEKEVENWNIRSFLKGCDIPSKKIDSIVYELYQKVSSEIDCKTCANCCREVQPVLDQNDIEIDQYGRKLFYLPDRV